MCKLESRWGFNDFYFLKNVLKQCHVFWSNYYEFLKFQKGKSILVIVYFYHHYYRQVSHTTLISKVLLYYSTSN